MMNTTTTITWQAGDALPARTLEPVTRLQLIKYAGASGDYNPIHTIDQAASEAGLTSVIQHGMLTMAEVGRLFSPYQDQGYVQR
ncbi:MAG: dehydratase, partial [Chloroflexi bacterium]|nr:dehydratase [Chloroflexota bacterium]